MEKVAFVVTPYTERFSALINLVIRPALELFGIVVRRADDIVTGARISDKVSEMISGADIIICDVSEINANVFFETGLARAQNKNIIILCDKRTNVPVDFDGMTVLYYNHLESGWDKELTEKLINIIKNSEFSNRVYEFNEESSLAIYIKYNNLTLSDITAFLHNLDLVHQSLMSATSPIYYIPESEKAYKNTLLVNRAYTGNSINFSFKEGWLPSFEFEDNDLEIAIPKNLGIPALLGIALLNSANQVLDIKNKYLDNQIKEIDLMSKTIEYNKKVEEQNNRALKSRSNKTIKQLVNSTNITHVEVNNIQIINKFENPNN